MPPAWNGCRRSGPSRKTRGASSPSRYGEGDGGQDGDRACGAGSRRDARINAGARGEATATAWHWDGGSGRLAAALNSLGLGILWGFTFLVIKWGLRDAGPMTLGALRVLIGAAGLAALARGVAGPMPSGRTAHLQIAAVGIVQVGLFGALLNLGTAHAGIGVASLVIYSQPAIVAVLAVLWLHEPLRRAQAVGVLLGVLSLALVVSGRGRIGGVSLWRSYALLFGAAASWAVGAVLYRRLRPDLPFFWAVALQTAYAAVPLCVVAVAAEGPELRFTWRLVAVALFLGLGASGVAYLLWFRLLTGPSAVAASTSLLLVPLWAAIFGVLFLGESWGARSLVGALGIAASIFLVHGRAAPARDSS